MSQEAIKSDLSAEEVPSLTDFAEEPGGAWPPNWYAAETIEGYATGRGKVFTTADEPSRDGSSRNLFICVKLSSGKGANDGAGHSVGPGQVRNLRECFNYRPEDFTPDRLAQIKELRAEFRGQRGAWPGQADAQRSSLSIAKLGQLEKAIGFRLKRRPDGALLPGVFVGQKVDVRLGVDENGYNEITAFASAGTRAAK